jgi:hypothetical protein
MKTFIRSLLLACGFAGAPAAAAQLYCPLEVADSREFVTSVVAGAEYSGERQDLGLPTVTTTQVRRLADGTDLTACQRINQFLNARTPMPDWRTHWSPVFYTAGGYYYAILVPVPNTSPVPAGKVRVDLRWTPLFVLKSDFTLVAAMAI